MNFKTELQTPSCEGELRKYLRHESQDKFTKSVLQRGKPNGRYGWNGRFF
jgi:hypothetical protein